MPSTRGYFLGQIIDDLDSIAHQVATRAELGYTDLNRMLEDFFRDVLNIVLDCSLNNLNVARSNEPGLDLGDTTKGIAFQVTSRADAAKVNSTLRKVTADHLKVYPSIRVLVIGAKQRSYALDDAECERVKFGEQNIWDITDVCRRATSLTIVRLQDLHKLVTAEVARVKIELEVPRPDGSYPTSLHHFIEPLGKPKLDGVAALVASEAAGGTLEDKEEVERNLTALAYALASLPRISREFLAFVTSKAEYSNIPGSDSYVASAGLIQRLSRYPNTENELEFLVEAGFLTFNDPQDYGQTGHWRLRLPIEKSRYFYLAFFTFLKDSKIDPYRVFVNLDFSDFGGARAAP